MEKNLSNLRSWGYVLLFFAAIDAIKLVINNIFDLLNPNIYLEVEKISGAEIAQAVNIIAIIIIAICAVAIFIQIYLGIRALQISKNPTKAKGHIILAKFAGVISIIAAVCVGFSIAGSTDLLGDLLALGLCICNVLIFFFYAHDAKKVRESVIASDK